MRALKWAIIGCYVVALLPSSWGALPIPPNVRVSGHQWNIQNEEQVWIFPNDTNLVITNHRDFRLGYRQIAIGRSIDGGASWVDSLIPLSAQVFKLQSDPGMTVTSDGVFVISHLDYATSGDTIPDSSLVSIMTSDDGGQTWSGPHTIMDTIGEYFEDKPFITSDRSGGVYDGMIYASWTRTPASPRTWQIMFSRSADKGVSWDEPAVIGPPQPTECPGFGSFFPAGWFSQPLVGKDGAVYVFWQGFLLTPPSSCIIYKLLRMNKSTDGGLSWHGVRDLWGFVGAGFIEGDVSTYNQPVSDADLSDGPHAGNLYLQYTDRVAEPPYNEEIWFQRSLDTGHTWSVPLRVNDDPVGPDVHQFHNWMVCNEEGILVSVWYDQRTDPAHYKFDVFAAYSYDGGSSWTSNHRVSSVSIDPLLLATNAEPQAPGILPSGMENSLTPNAPMAGKIAEYIGVACSHDKIVAVWTDTRDGDQDVWSARWHLPLTDPRMLTDSGFVLSCNDSLRWATAWKEAEDRYYIQVATSDQFGANDLVAAGFTQYNSLAVPPGLPDTTLHWRIKAYRAPYGIATDSTAYSATRSFAYVSCPCACDCHRDPMCDNSADIIDVVTTVDVAFNGAAPSDDPSGACPYMRTDVDCNSVTDVIDVVLMVNVVYRHAVLGPGLCGLCD